MYIYRCKVNKVIDITAETMEDALDTLMDCFDIGAEDVDCQCIGEVEREEE